MLRPICLAAMIVVLSMALGYGAEPPPASPPVQAPPLQQLPASITVKQRSSAAVPGSSDKLQLTLDDITRGQVIASLSHAEQGLLIPPTSFKVGAAKRFKLGAVEYQLTLMRLRNALIGSDYAEFEISQPISAVEREKIEKLIRAVETLGEAKFIRNGTEHTPKEAAEHLGLKLSQAGSRITTAEQFIEQLASKSSVSGQPYEIRLPDKSLIPAETFLRDRLREIEKEAKTTK